MKVFFFLNYNFVYIFNYNCLPHVIFYLKALAICLVAFLCVLVGAQYDYSGALSKSVLFFEAQRSGKLPANNR
jgi:hypothetical protein